MGILEKIRLVGEWKNQDFNLNTVRNRKHCLTPSGKQYGTILNQNLEGWTYVSGFYIEGLLESSF